jgi:hypothetical protein
MNTNNSELGLRDVTVDELTAVEDGSEVISWFSVLKSCADAKSQAQGELARFR